LPDKGKQQRQERLGDGREEGGVGAADAHTDLREEEGEGEEDVIER
jgi:hypothetical protein